MKTLLIGAFLCAVPFLLLGNEKVVNKEIMETKTEETHYLYKILSLRKWQATQNKKTVAL